MARQYDDRQVVFINTARILGWALPALMGLAAIRGSVADDPSAPVSTEVSETVSVADDIAREAIFGEAVPAANVFAVCRRAAGMSEDARYRFLSDWVLPGGDHVNFRLNGTFAPTSVPLPSSDGVWTGAANSSEIPGAKLVAPALDLIDTAERLGRLDRLRDRVERIAVEDRSAGAKAREALLYLMAVARNDAPAAARHMGVLLDRYQVARGVEVGDRWPETLALTRGVSYRPTQHLVGEFLYLMFDLYVADREGWRTHATDEWNHHFFSLLGTHKSRVAGDSQGGEVTAEVLRNWAPVTRATARSYGLGMPPPRWRVHDGQAGKVAGHDTDYLYFRLPLRGNYAIECDLKTSQWDPTELLAAGVWAGPRGNTQAYHHGGIRAGHPRQTLAAPLSAAGEWSRCRVVVRDGVHTTYVNGRKLHEQSVGDQFDPWAAIRVTARSHGAVRNLRVTGSPVVPREIDLAANPDLPGWIPYFDETVGSDGEWRSQVFATEEETGAGIIATARPELDGMFQECLLSYHRPMLEDGTIEYEFRHDAGVAMLHPALDRMAFLLRPEGVRVHGITDGKYDRTGIAPDNERDEPEFRRGSEGLPLIDDAWNRVRVSLQGDTVFIHLNDELIYERELPSENRRTFGLFRYAGRAEAEVRNIVWHGEWPQEYPERTAQELAGPEPECIQNLPEFPDEFHLDFTEHVPPELMEFIGPQVEDSVAIGSDGIRVTPSVKDAWVKNQIQVKKTIYGDFDATLRFEDAAMTFGSNGVIGFDLNAVDDTGIIIAASRTQAAKTRISAAVRMTVPTPGGQPRYHAIAVPDESLEGVLRLVRRGENMHALIAHGDSPNFREIGTYALPSAGTGVQLHARAFTVAQGSVDVLLKSLTIRSNTTAIESRLDPLAVAINKHTTALPETYRHLFGAGDGGGPSFHVPDAPRAIVAEVGLRLRAEEQREAAVVCRRGVRGDFDLSTAFRIEATSVVKNDDVLSLEIGGDDRPVRASLHVAALSDGGFSVMAKTRPADSMDGAGIVDVASTTVGSVDGLRIVRIQRTLFFLYAEQGFYRLLGRAEVVDADVPPGSVRFVAQAAEDARAVVLKAWDIRAADQDTGLR